MTSKNGSKGSDKNAKWKGFAQVPLSTTDTLDVVEHAVAERGEEGCLLDLVQDGFKVSVSPLRDGSGCCVSLTGREGSGRNEGWTMTTFAGTPRRGILAAWYKHYVICGGEAWSTEAQEEGLEI